MAQNYDRFAGDVYMCTIQQFLAMFGAMYRMCENRELNEIIHQEMAEVMEDVQRNINLYAWDMEPVLGNHSQWGAAIFACRYHLCTEIDLECKKLEERAQKLQEDATRTRNDLKKFCEDISGTYFAYERLVNYHKEQSEAFYNQLKAVLIAEEIDPGNVVWIQDYEKDWTRCLQRLAILAIYPLLQMKALKGEERNMLLHETFKMRKALEEVVAYHDASTRTVLSEWRGYAQLRTEATVLAEMEMLDRFGDAERNLRRCASLQAEERALPENQELHKDVAKRYGELLRRYIGKNVDTDRYKILMLQQYAHFLETFAQLGPVGHEMIRTYTTVCWMKCIPVIQQLLDNEQIKPEQKQYWIRISETMNAILKET